MTTSTVPRIRDRPPPSCPAVTPRCSVSRARHWSASVLRSTSTSVEVAWRAIRAQAITVLPAPGGATSTPRSWSARSATARCLVLAQPGGESEAGLRLTGDPLIADHQGAARLLDHGGDDIEQTTREHEPPVERLVEAVQEPRHTPRRHPPPLSVVERGVRHGSGVLERGQHRRGERGSVDADSRAQDGLDGCARPRSDLRRGLFAQPAHRRPDSHRPDPGGEPSDLTRREPMQAGQVRPLVVERLKGPQVEEDRRAVLAGAAPAAAPR